MLRTLLGMFARTKCLGHRWKLFWFVGANAKLYKNPCVRKVQMTQSNSTCFWKLRALKRSKNHIWASGKQFRPSAVACCLCLWHAMLSTSRQLVESATTKWTRFRDQARHYDLDHIS
jgi:hypothetical protein